MHYFIKLVDRRDDGRMYSSQITDNRWEVEYKPGQWTWPNIKGTKLFVFDTLDNAISFIAPLGSIYDLQQEAWVCRAFRAEKAGRICPTLCGYEISRYWYARRQGVLGFRNSKQTPWGTWECDAVKLLTCVWQSAQQIRRESLKRDKEEESA